jgi:iron(III) transport system substrate-binding protein
VVVYVSADETIAREILQAFEEKTGIEVLPLFDTEATKTTGLASRLRAERARPRADLFWSSECFRMIELDEAGVLAPLEGVPFDEWMEPLPGQWRAANGTWFAFAPRARVIAYAPGRLAPEEVPTLWFELADPRWQGRVAMADPRFGTTSGHLGAMQAYWTAQGEGDRFDEWLAGLARNDVAVLSSGNAGVVEGIASGEYDLGMTDTDDVWAARRRGLDVALLYPRHASGDEPGGGTLLVPNTVARIADGPNPEGARLLAEWLLSEEVEKALAASSSRNIPIRGDAGEYAVPDPLAVDLEESARAMPSAIERTRRRLEQAEEDA